MFHIFPGLLKDEENVVRCTSQFLYPWPDEILHSESPFSIRILLTDAIGRPMMSID